MGRMALMPSPDAQASAVHSVLYVNKPVGLGVVGEPGMAPGPGGLLANNRLHADSSTASLDVLQRWVRKMALGQRWWTKRCGSHRRIRGAVQGAGGGLNEGVGHPVAVPRAPHTGGAQRRAGGVPPLEGLGVGGAGSGWGPVKMVSAALAQLFVSLSGEPHVLHHDIRHAGRGRRHVVGAPGGGGQGGAVHGAGTVRGPVVGCQAEA
mmetsp:Transcript_10669/g.23121  ORF Transcript_10669/g.23121 Transcript_10669/m.23121 type:complete len:207 (-) Transcript_10669:18-638(-)